MSAKHEPFRELSGAVFRSHPDRPFDQIDILQDLQPQVIIEIRIFGKERVDDREGLFASLPADKGPEPAIDEEDIAVASVA